ncbi:helix-turn-helix transcriptional regulator [Subsaximicrobium wynnwilliamsii]|uniref:Helix-turn-helix transcriptional regulator n=1 Tax=Subsaximicrobium wynnwilliamsii TaxID=291179 RepID=A0A5C6ZAL3_9FLAO|nr:helix-turn-helix transcriptional regulator [Subsaximicrobium wynnwilliamsii]TXD81178.1 helix-turn-helix transcriptional regulator [Subsaximicrobium wynnwilliamsii]TXD86995.1 helix-turn-helix transcriptional regulator [Subsaximicrobium wynnwilliamsii]TXE00648.1 helix-turn-helix transcriptional regulator [Subsaximicrobium wynnwilliamsii]
MNINDKTEFLISFGKLLADHRQKRKLSYRELAQLCDVDHSQISRIEKGQVSIQLTTLFELARGLDVHPKELLDFKFTCG